MLSSVLLPDPDGPISAQNSPVAEHEVDAVQHLGLDRRARRCTHLRTPSSRSDFVSHGSPPPDRAARARSAGATAASTPVSVASSGGGRRTARGSSSSGNSGVPSGLLRRAPARAGARQRRAATRTASRRARAARPASRNTRMICPREAPIARRMPISFDRCITETISTAGDAERDRQADEERGSRCW